MLHQKQIKDLMNKGNLDKNIVRTIFDFMYFMHQPFSEIMNIPIPLSAELMTCLEELKKAEAKAYKK